MSAAPPHPTPDRSLQQRREALGNANVVRQARAQLKRDLKDGKTTGAKVIADPPEHVAGMNVRELLMAIPKLGRTKVDRILTETRISSAKTLVGLTDRQRTDLHRVVLYTEGRLAVAAQARR